MGEYQLDLTEISNKLSKSDNRIYILSIIDTFSKFGGCYILNNKKGEIVLGSLKILFTKMVNLYLFIRIMAKNFVTIYLKIIVI